VGRDRRDVSEKRITLRQGLLQQFQLLVGMKLVDVLAEVSKVPMMRKSERPFEKLLGLGLSVILCTDNPDFLCQYLVRTIWIPRICLVEGRSEEWCDHRRY